MKAQASEDLLEKAKHLLPSAEILSKALSLFQNEKSSVWEIAHLVHQDPPLTAQVLTWSNSDYYECTEKSTDIEEALNRVGAHEIYKLIGLVMSKRLFFKASEFYGLDPAQFWENSITTAFAMEALATRLQEDTLLAYTVGLLHAIGKLIINELCTHSYQEVFELVDNQGYSLPEAESRVIGLNHAEIGEALLKKWNFGPHIYLPIGNQYDPLKAISEQKRASLLNIAHYMVATLGGAFGRSGMAVKPNPKTFEKLAMNATDMQLAIIEAQEKLTDLKEHLT